MARVVFLRDFILSYLLAKGGSARIEELEEALVKLVKSGSVYITGGPSELKAEIKTLALMGVLRQTDGVVELVPARLHPVVKRKAEKLAKIVTLAA